MFVGGQKNVVHQRPCLGACLRGGVRRRRERSGRGQRNPTGRRDARRMLGADHVRGQPRSRSMRSRIGGGPQHRGVRGHSVRHSACSNSVQRARATSPGRRCDVVAVAHLASCARVIVRVRVAAVPDVHPYDLFLVRHGALQSGMPRATRASRACVLVRVLGARLRCREKPSRERGGEGWREGGVMVA